MAKMPQVNEARNRVTRATGIKPGRWLGLMRGSEGAALWRGWVLTAPSNAEMLDRAMVAFADEQSRAARAEEG